jgi:Asp-tRNA(Asn)/Glu-tRNA(Gln) amidotransferase A subunit family amidase
VGGSPEGLPIGMQIVARPYEDEIALGIATIVEEAFGYRPPPMARVSAEV